MATIDMPRLSGTTAYDAPANDPVLHLTVSGALVSVWDGVVYPTVSFAKLPAQTPVDILIEGQVHSYKATGIHLGTTGGTIEVGATGNIFAGYYGIRSDNTLAQPSVVLSNFGVIAAYVAIGCGEAADRLTNDGHIIGFHTAINAGGGRDLVVNRGTIVGDVVLGDGDDTYNGLGGSLDGNVLGGAGNDTYILDDDGLLIFDADGDADWVNAFVDYALGAGLENLALFGAAKVGSGNGADNLLIGNRKANRLEGRDGADELRGEKGNDRLFGGDGADVLDGGRGRDVLQGDAGADTFLFATGDGADRILDFDAADDGEKLDLSGLASITGFADLKKNHMRQVKGDVVIDGLGGDVVRLAGVDLDDLDRADFLF